ncbi:MAG: hypothetical protein HYU97_00020 [Deltaproteobacteria bacterium]|nr:hypothetical protein [Deltaproteobacteria bacterium]
MASPGGKTGGVGRGPSGDIDPRRVEDRGRTAVDAIGGAVPAKGEPVETADQAPSRFGWGVLGALKARLRLEGERPRGAETVLGPNPMSTETRDVMASAAAAAVGPVADTRGFFQTLRLSAMTAEGVLGNAVQQGRARLLPAGSDTIPADPSRPITAGMLEPTMGFAFNGQTGRGFLYRDNSEVMIVNRQVVLPDHLGAPLHEGINSIYWPESQQQQYLLLVETEAGTVVRYVTDLSERPIQPGHFGFNELYTVAPHHLSVGGEPASFLLPLAEGGLNLEFTNGAFFATVDHTDGTVQIVETRGSVLTLRPNSSRGDVWVDGISSQGHESIRLVADRGEVHRVQMGDQVYYASMQTAEANQFNQGSFFYPTLLTVLGPYTATVAAPEIANLPVRLSWGEERVARLYPALDQAAFAEVLQSFVGLPDGQYTVFRNSDRPITVELSTRGLGRDQAERRLNVVTSINIRDDVRNPVKWFERIRADITVVKNDLPDGSQDSAAEAAAAFEAGTTGEYRALGNMPYLPPVPDRLLAMNQWVRFDRREGARSTMQVDQRGLLLLPGENAESYTVLLDLRSQTPGQAATMYDARVTAGTLHATLWLAPGAAVQVYDEAAGVWNRVGDDFNGSRHVMDVSGIPGSNYRALYFVTEADGQMYHLALHIEGGNHQAKISKVESQE